MNQLSSKSKILPKKLHKILFVRFSSLGDTVMCLPIVQEYKRQNPDHEIHFLTKERYAGILKNEPSIKFIHTLADSKATTLFTLLKRLRRQHFDTVIDLHSSGRSRLVGFCLRFLRFNLKISRMKKPYIRRLLLVLFKRKKGLTNYSVMENYAFTSGVELNRHWKYPVANEDIKTVHQQLKKWQVGGSYVCLMAASTWYTKAWPQENFVALIQSLLKTKSRQVLLLGGRDDIRVNENIMAAVGPESKGALLNVAGKLSIGATAALLQSSQLLLTGDTGVMHIGSGLGIPVYAIFGGTSRELGFFPVTSNVSFIENTSTPCRPCSPKGKPACPKGHFECMRSISPDMVLNRINKS